MKSRIGQILDNLDRWRHLPNYQLERRADILFSLYLRDIIEWKLKRQVSHIIPEFPIPVDIGKQTKKSNLSVKMDYLVVLRDPLMLVFVELKTDPDSFRNEQRKYLLAAQKAQRARNDALIAGLLRIRKASKARGKYYWLVQELLEARLIERISANAFAAADSLPANLPAKILYIKPDRKALGRGIMVVSFKDCAKIVKKQGDELSLRFAESLLDWASVPAGKQ